MSNTQETPHSSKTSPRYCKSQQPPDHALLQPLSTLLSVLVPAGGDAMPCSSKVALRPICFSILGAALNKAQWPPLLTTPYVFHLEWAGKKVPGKRSHFQCQFHNQGEKIISHFTAQVHTCHCDWQQIHCRQRQEPVLGKLMAQWVVTKC